MDDEKIQIKLWRKGINNLVELDLKWTFFNFQLLNTSISFYSDTYSPDLTCSRWFPLEYMLCPQTSITPNYHPDLHSSSLFPLHPFILIAILYTSYFHNPYPYTSSLLNPNHFLLIKYNSKINIPSPFFPKHQHYTTIIGISSDMLYATH